MKSIRILLAVAIVGFTTVACNANPTAPDNSPPPVIGSGTGT